jgi:DNA-binding beta-propeller fold protein YncE
MGIGRWLFTTLLALSAGAYAGAEGIFDDNGGLQLAGSIPMQLVEGRIDHMAADLGGRLFVAALGSDMVEKIDTQHRIVVGSIRGIKEPQGLAYIPKSNRLAVASGGDGNVRIYDQNFKLIGTVNSLEDADNVRYDSAQDLLYVGYGQGALAIIDPAQSVKIAEIPLDGHPESFQLERKGKRIFVNVPTAGEVEVLDREQRTVFTRWKLTAAAGNFPMALDESHQRLFVGCRRPARLLVLNVASGQIVANMKACGDTDDLFYDSANEEIYLSGGDRCISVFDAADPDRYKELRTITTPPGARTSLFAQTSGILYVAVPHRRSQTAKILIFKATPKL